MIEKRILKLEQGGSERWFLGAILEGGCAFNSQSM